MGTRDVLDGLYAVGNYHHIKVQLVLYTFGENVGSYFTHLPLRIPLVPNYERREIVIAHIDNQFVQIFLHPYYPVPSIPIW